MNRVAKPSIAALDNRLRDIAKTRDSIRCKEKMAGKSKSIREQLLADIKELQRQTDALKAEATRTSQAGQRMRASQASNFFAKDFVMLQRSIRRDGQADPALIDRLRRDAERAVDQWRKAVERNPSRQNVEGMLSQVRVSELLGVDGQSVVDAMELLGTVATNHTKAAASLFRRMPTTKNFVDYLRTIRQAQLMGVAYDELAATPAQAKRPGISEAYIVKAGDTLSSIARTCYGSDSRWPDIWFANSQTVINPDQLITGMTLKIP